MTTWEPIPLDELTHIDDIVSVLEEDGECIITVYGEIFDGMLVLPPGVRICRETPQDLPDEKIFGPDTDTGTFVLLS